MTRDSLVVRQINCNNFAQCWGCSKRGDSDKFCVLNSRYGGNHSICTDCYGINSYNQLVYCLNCHDNFLLDYTKLKENDTIKYGFDEFLYCYECLKSKDEKMCPGYYGRLDELENEHDIENEQVWDSWNEEYEEQVHLKFNNLNDKIVRILGETTYNFNEEKNNIIKKVKDVIKPN